MRWLRDYGLYVNAARETEIVCSYYYCCYYYYLWSDRMLRPRWKRKEETQNGKIDKFPCKWCHRTGSRVLLLRVLLQWSSILKPSIVSLQRCRRLKSKYINTNKHDAVSMHNKISWLYRRRILSISLSSFRFTLRWMHYVMTTLIYGFISLITLHKALFDRQRCMSAHRLRWEMLAAAALDALLSLFDKLWADCKAANVNNKVWPTLFYFVVGHVSYEWHRMI